MSANSGSNIKPNSTMIAMKKSFGSMAEKFGKIKNKGNLFGLFIIVIVVAGMIIQTISSKKLKETKCNFIESNFTDPNIISVTPNEKDFQHPLYNYYIKAAYNCCAVGKFSNTVVSECALNNVIKSGVRFLDFEIYSMNGYKPMIGVSTQDKFNFKENNNSYYLGDALKFINRTAFTTSNGCKNPDDPIFLHFRVKSQHKQLYNNMAKVITSAFDVDHQLLGKDFSNAFNGYNLGKIPLHTLCKNGKFGKIANKKAKVVIILQIENKDYLETDLKELVNMESGSNFMNMKESFYIKTEQNKKGVIEHNKHNFTLVIPDKISKDGDSSSLECCVPGSQNPNFKNSYKVGCQIVCMCFQNPDSNLNNYNKFFHSKGTAFVLKPEALRYKVVCVDPPKPQKKANSFASRKVSDDYYSFDI